MNINHMTTKWLNIPNILSGFRLILAPFLLYLAWIGRPNLFLALLVVSLLSDSIDGFVARWFKEESELGAKLDTLGDFANYLIVPLCAWWLWPEIIKREAFFFIIAIGAYIFPKIVGFVKFQNLPSYHTWGAKIAAVLMSVAVIILFTNDITWPFRCSTIFIVFVAFEDIIITLRLSKLQSNVRSFWHLKRQAKKDTSEE